MKVLIVLAICLAIIGLARTSEPDMVRYDDYKIYKVFMGSEQQMDDFRQLSTNLTLHYLNDISGPGYDYEVVVDPNQQRALEDALSSNEFEFECVVQNLQEILEKTFHRPKPGIKVAMDWTKYQELYVIYEWLDSLVSKFPRLVQPITIGQSFEGHPIKGVKISSHRGNKAIFIESNIHAIEWISSAASTCFIEQLLNSRDLKMKLLRHKFDWIFIPVLNPDGFVYTHKVDRLWRKSRKPTGFSNSNLGVCYGVDLDRNFDFAWGAGHNFHIPCDQWYGGDKPQSEPEVQALTSYINSLPADYVRMYLSFHSFGNLVLLPYGHTNKEFPRNYKQMMRIATAFANAAEVSYGTKFKVGSSSLLSYPTSGSARDWAYGVKKIPFAASIELRAKDTEYGYFLPEDQILEVCEEVTDGLIAMIKRANREGIFSRWWW